jgi:ribosomal protein L25 (general stress protein Ctc)
LNSKQNNGDALWATRTQIAKRYAVHPGTIDMWRRAGYLPAVVYGTRLVRFDIAACDQWFNKFRHSAKWEGDSVENHNG